ncbi:hypothetical protein KAR91_20275 [Candidatus Pacearchaeota archaeon]|nr:hypothetical protein [Candidatus Pacearchaeota archaeon]
MTITTGNFPKDLWPGIKDHWNGLMEHPVEYTDLFDFKSSDKQREELVERVGTGLAPIKAQGAAIQEDSTNQGVVNIATHVAYGLMTIVTYEAIKDNLYFDQAMANATDVAFSMRQTKENVFAQFYNRAFNSSFTFGDASQLITTSHATEDGTQSNRLAIDANISETAIEDMCTQIMNATNSRGLKNSIMPVSLHVSPSDWWEANRILNSQLQNDSAENALNILKSEGTFPGGVKVNHYFTDPNAWFIRTNVPVGMCGFNRDKAEYEADGDFTTKNQQSSAYERYSGTIGNFRALYGSSGG